MLAAIGTKPLESRQHPHIHHLIAKREDSEAPTLHTNPQPDQGLQEGAERGLGLMGAFVSASQLFFSSRQVILPSR